MVGKRFYVISFIFFSNALTGVLYSELQAAARTFKSIHTYVYSGSVTANASIEKFQQQLSSSKPPLEGHFASFQENDKGSIEVGKLADFTVLSADIMKISPPEILKTRAQVTIIGGEVVYQAN